MFSTIGVVVDCRHHNYMSQVGQRTGGAAGSAGRFSQLAWRHLLREACCMRLILAIMGPSYSLEPSLSMPVETSAAMAWMLSSIFFMSLTRRGSFRAFFSSVA